MHRHRQHAGNRAGEADNAAVGCRDRCVLGGCDVDAPVARIGADRSELADDLTCDR